MTEVLLQQLSAAFTSGKEPGQEFLPCLPPRPCMKCYATPQILYVVKSGLTLDPLSLDYLPQSGGGMQQLQTPPTSNRMERGQNAVESSLFPPGAFQHVF